MTDRKRISVPWARSWSRFRSSVLPLLTFIPVVALTLWMWDRQGQMPNMVAEMEAVQVDVVAGADGLLVPLSRQHFTLFDTVQANELVARLDDRPTRAAIDTLRTEIARLRKEMDAAEVQFTFDEIDHQHDHQREATRFAWLAERRRLDVLDRRAQIEADRVDLRRRDVRLIFLKRIKAPGVVTAQELVETQLQRDVIAKRIEQNMAALAEANKQRLSALESLKQFPPIETVDLITLLAPIQASIAVRESRIYELQIEIESLDIRAPISGTICTIHCWPGQALRAGDPIVTIAADHGRYIVGYVRQAYRFRPTAGSEVDVFVRASGARPRSARVERVGPQIQLVPPHQRRDPMVPEWGLPVRITIPDGVRVRPGELVDVGFKM